MVRGLWRLEDNRVLIEQAAKLYDKSRDTYNIQWNHVFGHTGDEGNELADKLAGKGSEGRVSGQFKRWARPDQEVIIRRRARGPPRGLPRVEPCPKCVEDISVCNIARHTEICKGPGDANLRCLCCNRLYGSVVARMNHERKQQANHA